MAREFLIRGTTLIVVGTLDAVTRTSIKNQELGLTIPNGLSVKPKFHHKDMKCDDFGPDTPPEVMFDLAEVMIQMTLVHFDNAVAGECINQSMAGSLNGTLTGCGSLMGGNFPAETVGNHFIGLYLISVGQAGGVSNIARCLHFPTAYLTDPAPLEIPIGVNRTLLSMTWRAIPYRPIPIGGTTTAPVPGEVLSSGTVLFDGAFPTGFENIQNL